MKPNLDPAGDTALRALMDVIAGNDVRAVGRMLAATPALARAGLAAGATRAAPRPSWLAAIAHYVYAGDTALHVAAAAHRPDLARTLIAAGAPLDARNRRAAAPLHYAADGGPGLAGWDARAQGATIAALIAAGADANPADAGGVTPLHRAVRNRCAEAVRALLAGGADAGARTARGTTAAQLATRTTGRGGSGTPEAKAQAAEIVRLLAEHA
jgi:hypothetical protein